MHENNLSRWQHDHSFGNEKKRTGEKRTLIVTLVTAVMMVVEILSGVAFGSMALLADGLHMGSHAAALSISLFAYIYSRKNAGNPNFSFGTGKVNALGGYSGAILLVVFASIMAIESIGRFLNPVAIAFNQAIAVAVVGLIVNGVCAAVLDHNHDSDHSHDQDSDHSHGHHDHNLRAAYLHVLADALTSILAIFALMAGKYFGLLWMDPAMGIVGTILITKWSWGLLKTTSGVLLDRQAPESLVRQIREKIEGADGNRVTDLHVWSIGPNQYAAELALVTHQPKEPHQYKEVLLSEIGLKHLTVEVNVCSEDREEGFPSQQT